MTSADPRPRSRSRRVWSLFDQGLSSLTNFAMTILVASLVSAEAFGVFALVYGLALVALGASRGLVANPYMVRFTDGPTDVVRAATRGLGGALVVLGGVLGVAVAAGSRLFAPSLAMSLLVLAIALPGVLLQDGLRFVFFARGDPRDAALSDGVWALVQFALLAMFARSGLSAPRAMVAWGAGAAVGGLVGLRRAHLVPSVRSAAAWFRDHRDLGVPFAAENVLKVASRYVVLSALGGVIGVVAVGSIRGAEELLGVLRPLLVAIPLVGIPEGVRLLARGEEELRRACHWLLVALVLLTGTWGTAMVLAGDRIGRLALGDTWQGASTVMVPMAVATVAMAAGIPASFGLRVLGDARRSLRARVTASLALVGFGVAGATMGGARGAAIGIMTAELLGSATWWWLYRRGMGTGRAPHLDRASGQTTMPESHARRLPLGTPGIVPEVEQP